MKKLNFLGKGAALSSSYFGTTAAFIIEDSRLLLIDCGSTAFAALMRTTSSLRDITDIYVMITHSHDDHVGSLGSLMNHCRYTQGAPRLHVVIDDGLVMMSEIVRKVQDDYREIGNDDFVSIRDLGGNIFKSFTSARYVDTQHVSHLRCRAIVFDTGEGVVFYSGDTKDCSTLASVVKGKKICRIYHEASLEDDPVVHTKLSELASFCEREGIPKDCVFIMHGNAEVFSAAECRGFNVVEVVGPLFS